MQKPFGEWHADSRRVKNGRKPAARVASHLLTDRIVRLQNSNR